MANIEIALTRYEVDKPKEDLLSSYPLVVRAVGLNIPSEIFVYHAVSGETPYEGDTFEAVATPNHLEELPKNKPYVSSMTSEAIPYYRRNQIELLFRSAKELELVWRVIKKEVADLVENYKALNSLKKIETVEIDENKIEIQDNNLQSTIGALYAEPATSEDLSDSGDIVKADNKVPGWLPIESGSFKNAPEGAKLFYNLSGHVAVKNLFDYGITLPSIQRVLFNGYDYGSQMYEVTAEGIFWKDFQVEDFPEDKNLPQPTKNPWSDDHVLGFGSSQPNTISLVSYFGV
tara:strand:- start:12238 stop:13104 length:867 start_codon:yes stop_codon:yes gene_type:complete